MKRILEFPDYSIDTEGNIYSHKTNKFLRLNYKKRNNKPDYITICLYKNDKAYYRTVHKLVAQTFLPNPHNKPQINHKDGNKHNPSLSNLEWVTPKENMIHAEKHKLVVKHGREYPIVVENYETGEIIYFKNTRTASRYFNKNKTYFSNLLLNILAVDYHPTSEYNVTKVTLNEDQYYF